MAVCVDAVPTVILSVASSGWNMPALSATTTGGETG